MRILLVTPGNQPARPLPAALALLPHEVVEVSGADRALADAGESPVAVVDGRFDPAAARTTCALLASSGRFGVLLLVLVDSLPVLTGQWDIDDVIIDSAGAAEFDARIRLLAQRRPSASRITAGPITVDEVAYTATVRGRALDLTYTEFELLKHLVQHPMRVFSREQLLSDVWGYDYYGGIRTVDVHVRRLRAKLGTELERCIDTVRNVGYRFNPDHDDTADDAE
ncbi:MAG: response regulator transcription factor [Propionibacteriaceae bacterium]|nr:response regulator transcription factor [Propionibacteriaceae bacterium]